MRLWSLHPKYLDPKGLVALWRETLLAQAVLRGETRGYGNHPQLDRFKAQSSPRSAISLYLEGIHAEAAARGYSFDKNKIRPADRNALLAVTSGQIEYEWDHLLAKLKERNLEWYRKWQATKAPEAHPLFHVRVGRIEPWERQ